MESATERQRLVGEEGFRLYEVDRHIDTVDRVMGRALGEEASPVNLAIDIVRAQGRVALGDIGCGTGRSLSSWRWRVAAEAPCDIDQVTGVGVTLKGYSADRDEKTQQAWQRPGLEYIVRNVCRGVSKIPDSSLDVIVAYATTLYWKDPEAGLDEVKRIAKPGAHFMFNNLPDGASNITRIERERRQAITNTLDQWSAQGIKVIPKHCITRGIQGDARQLFYQVIFPEAA